MEIVDYYEVLQVSPTASFEVIKASFRQLSKMYHPDTSNQDGKKFILIQEAYEILSDERKRNDYDEYLRANRPKENTPPTNNENEPPQNKIPKLEGKSKKPIGYLILIGVGFLFMMTIMYSLGFSQNSEPSVLDVDAVSEIYSISLPKEEYSKIKTTEHILNYGEAYFDIYNGTNLTIRSITIEIKIKNSNGEIIDTRQFQKDVYIDPLSVENEINITTGIQGLPAVGENDLHIQPEYISWSFIKIIGDNLQ